MLSMKAGYLLQIGQLWPLLGTTLRMFSKYAMATRRVLLSTCLYVTCTPRRQNTDAAIYTSTCLTLYSPQVSMFGEVKGLRPPGRPNSSFNDVTLRDCRGCCVGRPYRDAQDRLLCRDKPGAART